MKISSNQGAREKKAHFEFGLLCMQTSRGAMFKSIFTYACGSCLDIYLSGAKRIYYRIYYLWIYLCLKIGFIAVDLTELSYFKNRWKFTLFYNLV